MAADRHIPVEIGGKVYRLHYTVAAIREVQRLASKPFNSLLVGIQMIDFDAIVYMILAALRHEHGTLSVNGAAEIMQQWIDEGARVEDIVRALDEATIASGLFRPIEEGEQGNPQTGAPERLMTGTERPGA